MPDAVTTSLRARTALDVGRGRLHPTLAAQLLAIDETVRLHRPRQLDGEEPEQAQHWWAAGFLRDADVVAWLEAGVPWSTSAQQLRDAGVTPREVAGQYEVGVTLGLAFARGEVSLDRVLELRRPARPEVIDEDPPQEHEVIAAMGRTTELACAELRQAVAAYADVSRQLETERRHAAALWARLADATHALDNASKMTSEEDVARFLTIAADQTGVSRG